MRAYAVRYQRIDDLSAPGGYRLEEIEAIPTTVPMVDFYEAFPGYTYTEGPCECRLQRNASARLQTILSQPDIPEDCLKYTLDDFSGVAAAYAKEFIETGEVYDRLEKVSKPGLLLIGPTGTGKTTLGSLIFRAYVERGVTAVWTDFNDLVAKIRWTYEDGYTGPSQNQIIASVAEAQFLFLDDLGSLTRFSQPGKTPLFAEDAIEAVRRIFNHRLSKRLPIASTTNLTKEQQYKQFGERVVSRLRGLTAGVTMQGDDYRAPGDRK